MATFIMLTHLSHGALRSPSSLESLEQEVVERIESEYPDVKWVDSYAVLGPCDYLDLFEAPDSDTALKVATIIRTFGHSKTEVWPVTKWDKFKEMIRTLRPAAEAA